MDECPQNGSTAEKEERLIAGLARVSSVVIALSGGVDSAWLAWAAHRAIGRAP